jgi:hypothetical protein
MRTMALLLAACVILVRAPACAGKAQLAEQDSNAAGSANAGAARAGDSGKATEGGAPGEVGSGGSAASCPRAPDGATPGAYPTTFRFRAPPGQKLYLLDCVGVGFKVSACEDGYVTKLVDPYCEDECDGEDTSCMLCGACLETVVTVTDTTGTDAKWSGERYEDQGPGQTGAKCMCYVRRPLTAGRYRVEVPVYSSSADALDGEPAFTATQDVDITVPNSVITVTLQE